VLKENLAETVVLSLSDAAAKIAEVTRQDWQDWKRPYRRLAHTISA
jgi:hypothetical protein